MTFAQIFSQSIASFRDNYLAALKISGAIFIAVVFLSTAFNVLILGQLFLPQDMPQVTEDMSPEKVAEAMSVTMDFFFALILTAIVQMIGFSWIAVSWHRFVLAKDMPDAVFPNWNASRVFSYLGRSILLGLVIGLVLVVPLTLVMVLMTILGAGALTMPAMLVALVVGFYTFFRLGMILPAAAVDQAMAFKESLTRTEPYKQAIWALAFANIAIVIFASVFTEILQLENVIGVIAVSAVQWALMMISISFLTTIYKDSEGA